MDGPETPYRDGKPLTEIIPPDYRRLRQAAVVIASMAAGVALWLVGGFGLDAVRRATPAMHPPPPNAGYQAGRLAPSMLQGPGGSLLVPPAKRSIVHVWLQGCLDCMPAFEAIRDLNSTGGLRVGVPIYNVAYGEADLTWANRYGVSTNLVFDPGGARIVRPLGITTFTTLVIDEGGVILLRDRPDRPGYVERVLAALGE